MNKPSLLFLVLIVFLTNSVTIFSQSPDVTNDIIVKNNSGSFQILSFGLDPIATDGIDDLLGEFDLPPFPPPEAWDVRFWLPPFAGSLSSWKDFRGESNFPYTGQREHRLLYQIGEFTDTLFIEWNLPPEVTGVLQDAIIGTIINQSMQGTGSLILVKGVPPDPLLFTQLKMTIDYNNVVADVSEVQNEIPNEFTLNQNYPNPFNPSTLISFSMPVSSDIKLKVFDLLGNQVATITEGFYSAGNHSVEFNGSGLSSGIYVYQLTHSFGIISRKMTLLK